MKIVKEVPNEILQHELIKFGGICKELRDTFNTNKELHSKDIAKFLVAAEILQSSIDYYKDIYANALKEEGVAQYDFVDLNKYLRVTKGRAITEISNDAFEDLSLDEIRQAAKLTEKGLTAISRADVIDKYKKVLREASPSILIKALK